MYPFQEVIRGFLLPENEIQVSAIQREKKKIPLYAPTLPPTELPYAISVSSQTKFPMFVSFLIVLVRVVQGEKKSIGGDFYRKWPM